MPHSFFFRGREYEFYTDYRAWAAFECLMLDGDFPEYKKQETIYKLVMPVIPPHACTVRGRREINAEISRFYSGGENSDTSETSDNELPESRRVYALDYDFPYIYAAFMERYGIDLIDIPYLHWWKFRALFRGLHDCKFTEIVGIRATEITSEMSDTRRRQIEEQQEIYALPVSLSERRRIEAAQKMYD